MIKIDEATRAGTAGHFRAAVASRHYSDREKESPVLIRHRSTPVFYQLTNRTVRNNTQARQLDARKFQPSIRLAHEHVRVVTARREVFDFCLMYFFAASGVCRINDVDHPFTPRTLLVVPPFKPSQFEMDSDMPARHIAVHFDVCEGFPDRKPLYRRKPYEIVMPPELEIPVATTFPDRHPLPSLLLRLVEAWQRQDTAGALQANAFLSQLLIDAYRFTRMAGSAAKHTRVHRSVAAAVRHIEAHFAAPLSPEKISDAVGYSTNYLSRTFREEIGSPIMAFLTSTRIRRATELLRDSKYSVKEISRMVGYQNTQHFSRTFKNLNGVTPTQWRQLEHA